MSEDRHISEHFHCGYVAIIGEPNVGKSTLMNALLNQKLSIVTPKPQTTRHKVLGILSTENYQVIFLDTPGLISPTYMLQEVMMQSASTAMEDADLLLFMIDATKPGCGEDLEQDNTLRALQGRTQPVFLVINKVDMVNKSSLLPLMESYARAFSFREIFPISALKHDGTQELLTALVPHLPQHEPFYPLDIVSDQNDRFFVSEIVREKVFFKCRQEIPYSSTVQITEFKERASGPAPADGSQKRTRKWFVSADIYVERDSQKAILIGKGGSTLKEIGTAARTDIEEFLGHPVFLELRVKVHKNWREDRRWLEQQGYKA